MEVPIVVSEDNINVASFTDQIKLSVDIGPEGTRGSKVYSGIGSPPVSIGDSAYQGVTSININDNYLDLATGLWYRYDPLPIGWAVVGKISPMTFSTRTTLTFTTGSSAVFSIPLQSIFGSTTFPAGMTVANLVVQVTDVNASGHTSMNVVGVKTLTLNGSNVDIVFHGRTLASTTVAQSSGSVELSITVGVKA